MDRRTWPGVALLLSAAPLLSTSCAAPEPPAVADGATAKPIADPRALLAQMALKLPSDVQPGAAPLPTLSVDRAEPLLAAPPFQETAHSVDDAAHALDCLTAAVYYEARSEALDGQRAVAQVVLNRVRDRAYPASVCGVVYQGSTRSTGCQFTFTCDGSLRRPRDPGAWDRARQVAEAALAGSVYAPVGSATSYHTTAILPWWAPSLTRIATIGAHIFYRWRATMGQALSFRQQYSGVEPGIPASGATSLLANGQTDEASGVTIHRGGSTAPIVAIAATVPVAPTPRVVTASGVRVHRGDAMPVGDPTEMTPDPS